MELVYTETLGPAAADVWRTIGAPMTGPGTFVFVVVSAMDPTDTLTTQVLAAPEGLGQFAVVEHVATPLADFDLLSGSAWAGYQSMPVPLVDGSWSAIIRAKHSDATDASFLVKVIKL